MILAINCQVLTNVLSIIFSTVMSAVLIIVTIRIAKTNGKVQESISVSNRLSAELPIKLKVFELVNSYGIDFYNYFSKTLSNGNLGGLTVDKIINKLDEMNTNQSVLSTMLKVISANNIFTEIIEKLYIESDELYFCLNKCADVYVEDLVTGYNNMIELPNVHNFIADCLLEPQNYVRYAQNISTNTLTFLAQYKKIFELLENKVEPLLKEFMCNTEKLFN